MNESIWPKPMNQSTMKLMAEQLLGSEVHEKECLVYFYKYAIAPLKRKSIIFHWSSPSSSLYSRWKAATYELALISSSDPSTISPSFFFLTQLICWHMKCSSMIGDPLLTSSRYSFICR